MASTRFALEQIDTNLDESMGVREIDTRPILSPVPSRKDACRRPLREFGRVDLNMVEPDPSSREANFPTRRLTAWLGVSVRKVSCTQFVFVGQINGRSG